MSPYRCDPPRILGRQRSRPCPGNMRSRRTDPRLRARHTTNNAYSGPSLGTTWYRALDNDLATHNDVLGSIVNIFTL